MRNPKNIVISALIIAILIMAIGYSSLASNMQINGVAEIDGIWAVRIKNVEVKDTCSGCSAGNPEFTDTTVSFNAKLSKPGDTITYLITIANEGTIDAKLEKIVFDLNPNVGSEDIFYYISDPKDDLDANTTTSFTIKIEYNEAATTITEEKTKSLNGVIEYVQK